jgi:hypothetical protein
MLLLRLGQAHGIDKILTNRRPMNLILHCPACPEPGFNTEKGSSKTPFHLRYDSPNHEKCVLTDKHTDILTNHKRRSMGTFVAIE